MSEYKPIKTSIHDVSSALGIQVYGGSFETDRDFKAVHIRMSFIKDGKLLSNKTIGTGNSGLKSLRSGQVSVKIIDLDHLEIEWAPSN